MLEKVLNGKKLILASGSPRRHELLGGLDYPFEIDTKNNFTEEYPADMPVEEVPLFLAKGKSYGFHRPLADNEIIITADTMVLCKGRIMGKPHSKEEATEMLSSLSGNKHTVLTGVCIRSNSKTDMFTARTDVYFNELNREEIEYYLGKYKPYDKAGSYGVQEWIGYVGISRIDGSYYNVMGLPVQLVYRSLLNF